MNVLKFNPTTNEYVDGKVDIGDCSFTLPNPTLPITLATAYVDANYPNIAPYFSDYEHGSDWVAAQITAGASVGNLIITSDQTDCTLINNVNIWIAPNVTINSFSGDTIHDVYIDGQGSIGTLSLQSCTAIQCRARKIYDIRSNATSALKIFSNETSNAIIYMGDDVDLTFYGSAGTITIDGEALVELTGVNAVCSSISVINNSSLRARNIRVLGLLTLNDACFADLEGCELYRSSNYVIDSLGSLSLTNCWVHSGTDPIRINNGIKGTGTLILNNTIIYSGGGYSIYDGNTSGNPAPVHIYGGTCSNKYAYHCTEIVQSITVNSDLKYRAY